MSISTFDYIFFEKVEEIRIEAIKQVANCSLALPLELPTRFALTLTSFERLHLNIIASLLRTLPTA